MIWLYMDRLGGGRFNFWRSVLAIISVRSLWKLAGVHSSFSTVLGR